MSPCAFYKASLDKASRSTSSKVSRYGHPVVSITYQPLIRCYQVVVLCGVPYSKQLEVNDWTHANDIPFITADTRGLFGYA